MATGFVGRSFCFKSLLLIASVTTEESFSNAFSDIGRGWRSVPSKTAPSGPVPPWSVCSQAFRTCVKC